MDANGQSTAIRADMLTPVKFLLASGAAAVLNFCARIAFSVFVPYTVAIVLAFGLGMATAFVLNRQFVFSGSTNRLHQQVLWFVAVNLLALVQTLLVSLLLARIVLPKLGVTWHSEEIAHAFGIAVPIFTSYIGHQRLTFR
jgi:putative flippase GtrA